MLLKSTVAAHVMCLPTSSSRSGPATPAAVGNADFSGRDPATIVAFGGGESGRKELCPTAMCDRADSLSPVPNAALFGG